MPPNGMKSTTLVGKKMAAPGHAPDDKEKKDISDSTCDLEDGARPVGSARA